MNQEIKNSKVKYNNYIICDECKIRNHSNHSVLVESVKDTIISNKKILNEIQLKKSKNEETKMHFGINCIGCGREGISLRSVSFKGADWFICESCFVDGFATNVLKFILLTDEEAQHKRSKQLEIQSAIDALNLQKLKIQHDHNILRLQSMQSMQNSLANMVMPKF